MHFVEKLIETLPDPGARQWFYFAAVTLFLGSLLFGHAWLIHGMRRDISRTMQDVAKLERRFLRSRRLESKRHKSLKNMIKRALDRLGVPPIIPDGGPEIT